MSFPISRRELRDRSEDIKKKRRVWNIVGYAPMIATLIQVIFKDYMPLAGLGESTQFILVMSSMAWLVGTHLYCEKVALRDVQLRCPDCAKPFEATSFGDPHIDRALRWMRKEATCR